MLEHLLTCRLCLSQACGKACKLPPSITRTWLCALGGGPFSDRLRRMGHYLHAPASCGTALSHPPSHLKHLNSFWCFTPPAPLTGLSHWFLFSPLLTCTWFALTALTYSSFSHTSLSSLSLLFLFSPSEEEKEEEKERKFWKRKEKEGRKERKEEESLFGRGTWRWEKGEERKGKEKKAGKAGREEEEKDLGKNLQFFFRSYWAFLCVVGILYVRQMVWDAFCETC